jgi:hypothetical protein
VTEIALATLVLYAYDLPVRAWLSRRFVERRVAVPAVAE